VWRFECGIIQHMIIFHSKHNDKVYDIKLEINAYIDINKKDKQKINKVVHILNTLGCEEEEEVQYYSLVSEQEDEELLLDVQYRKPEKVEEKEIQR